MRVRVRAFAHVAGGGAVVTALLAGCVHFKATSFGPGGGDTATFVIDGGTTTVTQSGTITVSGTGTPLDYSGPLGCAGRYFDGDSTDDISMDFRYSSQDAFLLIGSDLYHFERPPIVGDGKLRWQEEFADRTIAVIVSCRPPPSSGPLSPAPTG